MSSPQAQAALRRVLEHQAWGEYRAGRMPFPRYQDLIAELCAHPPRAPSMPTIPDGPALFAHGAGEDPEVRTRDDGPTPQQVRVAREHFGHSHQHAAAMAGVTAKRWLSAETGGGAGLQAVEIDAYVLRAVFAALGDPWPWVRLCDRVGHHPTDGS